MKKPLLLKTSSFVLLSFLLTGCDVYVRTFKRMSQKAKPVVEVAQESVIEKIETVELAKIILEPRRYPITIKKDPFRPLKLNAHLSSGGDLMDASLDAAKYLGMVKLGKDYSALLKIGNVKGAFAKNENVGGFTIINIQQEFVELKKGQETFQLKRGGK